MSWRKSSSRRSKLACRGGSLPPAEPSLDVAGEVFFPQIQAWMARRKPSSGSSLCCRPMTIRPFESATVALTRTRSTSTLIVDSGPSSNAPEHETQPCTGRGERRGSWGGEGEIHHRVEYHYRSS